MKKFVFSMVIVAFLIVGCSEQKSVNWVPSLENFKNMTYKRVYTIRDLSGTTDFQITVASNDQLFLDKISEDNFTVEMLPLEDDSDLPKDRTGAGVIVDGETVIEHTEHAVVNTGLKKVVPPVFIKVHALLDDEPARFRLQLHDFPESDVSVVANSGHYKSIVLRRNGSGSSYAIFYHHHGDWNLHILYQGWFTRCTYAYDCYAGHSIPSWRTSRGDEMVEFRADCYGRCP